MDVASRNSECVNSTDIFGRKCSARVVRIINGYFGSFEYFQIVLVLSNTRGQCQRLVEFDSVTIKTCDYLDYEGKSCSLLTQFNYTNTFQISSMHLPLLSVCNFRIISCFVNVHQCEQGVSVSCATWGFSSHSKLPFSV